jgi:flagellar biosynthesis protein FliQ
LDFGLVLRIGLFFCSLSQFLSENISEKNRVDERVSKSNIQDPKSKIKVMDMFSRLANEGLWLILILSLLPLLASLVVGLVVSLFQALTQIQEQTLTFVPKIIATILVIMITAGWMMDTLREFAVRAFDMMLQISVVR